MRYTFGYTETAAERVRSIAEFFNPLAYEFIQKNINRPVTSATDLGCGPGFTTRMLASATQVGEIIGMDISDYFIEIARILYPELKFIKQDVAQWNSDDKYDVLYCRFLLSHLINLDQILRNWIKHLNPGGLIFIDELEDIYTDVPVFRRYLDMNNVLIKSHGAELFVGKILDKSISGSEINLNRSDRIPVYDWQAAGWFYPNTTSIWNLEEVVLKSLNVNQRRQISDELLDIYNNKSNQSNITWKMKRIILTT